MAVTPFKSSDNFNMAGFNEKITEADNTYVAKTGDSMTGALSMGNNKITDVASPVNDGDVANKGYVDGKGSQVGSYTGDGQAKTINFSFNPSVVIFQSYENDNESEICFAIKNISFMVDYEYTGSGKIYMRYVACSWSNNSLSFDSTYINHSGVTYNWVAIP